MCEDNAGEIIEGIGNEVLFAVPAILAAIVGLLGFVGWQQLRQLSSARAAEHLWTRRPDPTTDRLDNGTAGHPDGNRMQSPRYGADAQCPICLTEPRYPVETNCGHLFCANCLVLYWRHGNWRGAVRCPVCRQQVSVMLRCFQEQQVNEDADVQREERSRLLRDINDYNRRFSGEPRPWLDHLRDLPTLLRHAGSEFFSVGGIMYMFRLRIVLCFVAAVMYLISPLDMIPEAIFGILGLLDDVFVVLLLAIYVTVIYRRFLATRWQEETT
ncbi:E3 ubiquitin-protein ligase RNF170 [Ixodes scapularis]|uniref:E3 ubiquitin-protein ligase RNF170 n=1 Tax=Ixodes scapularis TaxID=6945 RepID=UPI001C38ACC8|nr:E3 ubiquitin-protein ligase RNF170 [Ixodes scapularis]